MKSPLSDELRIRHVLDWIREIKSYLLNVSLNEFLANSEKRFPILYAAKKSKTRTLRRCDIQKPRLCSRGFLVSRDDKIRQPTVNACI
jgi:hypothetical protein